MPVDPQLDQLLEEHVPCPGRALVGADLPIDYTGTRADQSHLDALIRGNEVS